MTRLKSQFCIFLIFTGCVGISVARSTEAGTFFDDFHNVSRYRWLLSDGWSNGDHQSCTWTRRNARIDDGKILLTVNRASNSEHKFYCAELQSRNFYGYGTYEVRMKAATGSGLVSAFFTYTGPPHGRPHDEIDFEFIGKRMRSVDVSYHAKGNGGITTVAPLEFDASADFHSYAFHWEHDLIRWYADGKLLHEAIRSPDDPFPTMPGKIYLSIWSGGEMLNSWLGPFQFHGPQKNATFDYVAFTKLGDPCQFPGSVVCTFTGAAPGGR